MKRFVIIYLLLTIVNVTFGQKEIRDANYHFTQENYTVALKHYEKLYKSDTTNLDFSYRLGVCLLNSNKTPKDALQYLEKAGKSFGGDGVYCYELGMANLYNHYFDAAIQSFEKCKVNSQGDEVFIQEIDKWIGMCKTAKTLTSNPLDVSFVNLGKYINTEMDEYTPMLSPTGKHLVYTSNQKYDSKFFYHYNNVYMVELVNGVFKKGKSITSVNTMEDEFAAGFSMNGERLYVQLQGYEGFQDLVYTSVRGKGYQGKTLLNEAVNSKGAEFAAIESINGDTLYFSSDRPEGMGGMDIYYSLRLPTGDWSVPRNIGAPINSPYDDDFPTFSRDGQTFYFCSNRPESMGGYDVFESKVLANTKFGTPKNIGYPLNDVFDNKTIAFSPNNRYAYVSAHRDDSYGSADLYRVIFNQNDPSVKIFLLKLKLGNAEQSVDLAAQDTTIKAKSFSKAGVVFGEYSYKSNNSEIAIALPPGSYVIKLSGVTVKDSEFKLVVPDVPSDKKIQRKNVFLELKE